MNYSEIAWEIPMLVVHSRSDEVFPFRDTQQAVAAIEASGNTAVQLYSLEKISHYESTKYVEPLKEAVAWVKQVWDAHANEPSQ